MNEEIVDDKLGAHQRQQKGFINNQDMSDVTFMINEEPVYAHRAMLGMHSKVFHSMLFNGMKESKQQQIELVDIEKDTFLLLLEYIYCGGIQKDVPLRSLVSLLAAADKYDMPPLKEICKLHIEHFLREDSVLEVLVSATMFHSWELKEKCYEIIDNIPDFIFSNPHFATLSAEVIEDILKRDQLRCAELNAFMALISWGKSQFENPEELREVLGSLVGFIRFPLMRSRDLITIVEPEGIVPDGLLLEAYRYASLEPDLKRNYQSERTKPRAAISEYPIFDANTLQATITISADHKLVTKRGTLGFVLVLAKSGYTSGVHRWRVKVDGLVSNQCISVGVALSKASRTSFSDAFHWAISSSSQIYAGSSTESKGVGMTINNNNTLEVTLDMHIGQLDVKNTSTGAAVSLTVPVNEELFPAVGLHTLGNKVWFSDYN